MAQKANAGTGPSSFRNLLSLIKYRNKCIQKGEDYRSRFENASDEAQGFKFLLLMDLECLEAYITDTRIHARMSFWLCVGVSLLGTLLLFAAIGLGIASQMLPNRPPIEVSYLTAAAGIITQFISGIFFYFYNMTLRQINRFHSQLESSRKLCISLYLQSLLKDDPAEQNKAKMTLIKLLSSGERSEQPDQVNDRKQNEKPQESVLA